MREMIAAFRRKGIEVETCIAGGENDEQAKALVQAGQNPAKGLIKKAIPNLLWESLKDRSLLKFDAVNYDKLLAHCKRFQPDLIYERGYYLMESGIKVASELSINHFMEFNAPYVHERQELSGKSFFKNQAYAAEKRQVLNTNALVLVSTPLQKYFDEVLPGAAQKAIITPNAIDPQKIVTDDKLCAEISSQLGLKGKTVVGFVGSIFPYHGVDKLIQSFAETLKSLKNKEAFLLIVGGGAILEELKIKAASLGLDGKIHFTGSVPYKMVMNYIQCMDICVLASTNYYMSPIKIFEYGALGKAIIAPDQPAVRDVLTEGETGLLIKNKPHDLAIAIQTLIENDALRKKLGETFKEQVYREHTWDFMAMKVLNGFEKFQKKR
jgi:glycosyltransferase involved in cell wall biosynthesis